MKRVADGLYLLTGVPPNVINVYLMGDVVVDASTRWARRRILRQVRGHRVNAHALTHVHPDHQGSSHALCEALGVPLWVGERDADAQEQGLWDRQSPPSALTRLQDRVWTGPPHAVARRLREDDEVAGFTVLDVPGHSPGHVAYWRERDRVLVLGDVLNGMDLRTGRPGLHEPPDVFTLDPATNRASARRLAALEPALVCFGHGPPFQDTRRFVEFVERLST